MSRIPRYAVAEGGFLEFSGSGFCGSRSPELEGTKKRGRESGTRCRFRLFRGLCRAKYRSAGRKTADYRLDTEVSVGRGVRRPSGAVDWGRPDSRLVVTEDRAARSPRRLHGRDVDGRCPADLPPAQHPDEGAGRTAALVPVVCAAEPELDSLSQRIYRLRNSVNSLRSGRPENSCYYS